MDRLAFIAIMGGSIVVAPLVSEAQQSIEARASRTRLRGRSHLLDRMAIPPAQPMSA
jgi:hypothetical protein